MICAVVSGAADEQEHQRFCAGIGERVRSLARDEDSIARRDRAFFTADGHLSLTTEDVVNLFCHEMMMACDGCARRQDLFGQAAQLDLGRGAINQRTNLRTVRRAYDGGML